MPNEIPEMTAMATVSLLFNRDADVYAVNKKGCMVLDMIVNRGWTDVAQFLLERGANLNARDAEWQTLLYRAISTPAGCRKIFIRVSILRRRLLRVRERETETRSRSVFPSGIAWSFSG